MPDRIHYQIARCKHDGLLRSTPVFDENTLAKLYKKSSFTYHDEVENLTATYINALQPIVQKLPHSASFLEIGCGSGFVLQGLKKLGFTHVYGAEPSTHAVSLADASIQKKIRCDVFTSATFPQKKFDCVFFFQTFDHISNPEKFLKECYDVLKPGGYILSYHHNAQSFSAKILQEKSPIYDIEHTYLYDTVTTKKIFEKAHFTVKSVNSPQNILSLSHFLWLVPLPQKVKKVLTTSSNSILKHLLTSKITLSLGNVCIIAEKPVKDTWQKHSSKRKNLVPAPR